MNRPSVQMRIVGDGCDLWLEYFEPSVNDWFPELSGDKSVRLYPNLLSLVQDVLTRVRVYHSPIWITGIYLSGYSPAQAKDSAFQLDLLESAEKQNVKVLPIRAAG